MEITGKVHCFFEQEEWRDIEGFEGLYQVSNYGRVKSLSREIFNGKGYYMSHEKLLKPNVLAKGYLQIELKKDKQRHLFQVHRLVAYAFIPNPSPSDFNQVNHINGNKQDNRVENLEWCNNSLNQIHAWKIGLQKVSGKAGKPKKKVRLYKENVSLIFESVISASKFLGLKTRTNLQKVLRNVKHYHTIKGYKAEFYYGV